MFDGLIAKFAPLLPNGNLAIPFELTTVFTAVSSIWECLPVAIRMCLIGFFCVTCVFTVMKMLL